MSLNVNASHLRRPSPMDRPSATVPHLRVEDEDVIQTKYKMGEVLGQGSFGIVKEATSTTTGKKWAVKVVNKEKAGSSAVKLLEREVSILKKVNHEHIIHLEHVFETPKRMYLVMELCEHGELADMLKTRHHFSESDSKPIIKDLSSAISYLHKHDIVHRDLKLENILVHKSDDNEYLHIKVTDFGLSVEKDGVGHENMMQQFCGTPIYMPPEIVDNKTYSQQCDVWAMGVIMYYLLAGNPPFRGKDEESLYELIKRGDISFSEEFICDTSTAAHSCIIGMLTVDPAHRLTANEVLNHHWITGLEEDKKAPNVLELMKQWKDDLMVDDDATSPETTSDNNDDKKIEPAPEITERPHNLKGGKSRSPNYKYLNNNHKISSLTPRGSNGSSLSSNVPRKTTPSFTDSTYITDRDGSGKKYPATSTQNAGYLKSTAASQNKGRAEKTSSPSIPKSTKKEMNTRGVNAYY